MNEQGWSLDECLCEFTNVRSDLATLDQKFPDRLQLLLLFDHLVKAPRVMANPRVNHPKAERASRHGFLNFSRMENGNKFV